MVGRVCCSSSKIELKRAMLSSRISMLNTRIRKGNMMVLVKGMIELRRMMLLSRISTLDSRIRNKRGNMMVLVKRSPRFFCWQYLKMTLVAANLCVVGYVFGWHGGEAHSGDECRGEVETHKLQRP